MNIALVCDKYLPNIGGVEFIVYHLSKELMKNGHSVTIFANRDPINLKSYENIAGVNVYRFYFVLPTIINLKHLLSSPILVPFSALSFLRKLKEIKPDIIAVQFVSSNAFYALLSKKFLNIPMVSTVHGNDVQKFPYESKLMRMVFRYALRNSQFITGCSKSLLEDAKRFVPEAGEKMFLIPNGVDLNEFDSVKPDQTNERYILSAGRFVYKKGFDILINAFEKVVKIYQNIHLKIAGHGPEKDELVALIKKRGLENNIEIIDTPERKQLIKLFKGCEFFVLPSRIEPFGIVILEAMASKKAVIATKVDGVPEIVNDNVTGILAQPENVKDLAEKICLLLSNESLKNKLATNGRKLVEEKYTMDSISKRYLEVYEKAAERRMRCKCY